MNMLMQKEYRGARDPSGFDAIVREVFAPIYPVIASQIVQETQIFDGVCLDRRVRNRGARTCSGAALRFTCNVF